MKQVLRLCYLCGVVWCGVYVCVSCHLIHPWRQFWCVRKLLGIQHFGTSVAQTSADLSTTATQIYCVSYNVVSHIGVSQLVSIFVSNESYWWCLTAPIQQASYSAVVRLILEKTSTFYLSFECLDNWHTFFTRMYSFIRKNTRVNEYGTVQRPQKYDEFIGRWQSVQQ